MTEQVVTVTGPVPARQMGITDAHNHLWIAGLSVPAENAPVLDRMDLITQELIDFRQEGGSAQLDCQPGGAGRDGSKLYRLSQATGVRIVGCTGFHLREYYPEESVIWTYSTDQAREYFLSEIKAGMLETRNTPELVLPGFIKVAVRETLSKSPLHLLEAAVQASQESGLLIEMHTERGADVERVVTRLEDWGLPLDRLVVCHIDKRPDFALHQELAKAGCLLEYDTFFRPKYQPEEHLWPLLLRMIEAGLADSLALATDMADSSLWISYGGQPGLAAFPVQIRERLEEELSNASVPARLLGGNISNRLAVPVKERI